MLPALLWHVLSCGKAAMEEIVAVAVAKGVAVDPDFPKTYRQKQLVQQLSNSLTRLHAYTAYRIAQWVDLLISMRGTRTAAQVHEERG